MFEMILRFPINFISFQAILSRSQWFFLVPSDSTSFPGILQCSKWFYPVPSDFTMFQMILPRFKRFYLVPSNPWFYLIPTTASETYENLISWVTCLNFLDVMGFELQTIPEWFPEEGKFAKPLSYIHPPRLLGKQARNLRRYVIYSILEGQIPFFISAAI